MHCGDTTWSSLKWGGNFSIYSIPTSKEHNSYDNNASTELQQPIRMDDCFLFQAIKSFKTWLLTLSVHQVLLIAFILFVLYCVLKVPINAITLGGYASLLMQLYCEVPPNFSHPESLHCVESRNMYWGSSKWSWRRNWKSERRAH